MGDALKVLKKWAVDCGLNVNPLKTKLVMFTRRDIPLNFVSPSLDGTQLQLSTHAKYLEVILDSRLTWKRNAEERKRKSLNAFYACRKAFGKS